MVPNEENTRIRKMTRTMVESHPRYSAIPPQTPAIILSIRDFFNLAGMVVYIKLSLQTVLLLLRNLRNRSFNIEQKK